MSEKNRRLLIDAVVSLIVVVLFYFALNPLLTIPNMNIPIFCIGSALVTLGLYSLYNNRVKIGLSILMIGADMLGCVIVTLPLF